MKIFSFFFLVLAMFSNSFFSQPMVPLKQGFIPVVTAAQGGAGSFWRSDVWITNTTSKTVEVELWVWTGNLRGESEGKTYTIGANSSLGISNVVGDIGLDEGKTYFLNVNSQDNVSVGSRTYTESTERAGGTYGQFIPSFPYNKGFSISEKAIFPVPLDFTKARINVGIANPGWSDANVSVKIFDDSNNLVYSNSVSIKKQEVVQLNAINSALSGYANGYVLIEISNSSPKSIYPYVSVVDYTGSNDPSFMFTLP